MLGLSTFDPELCSTTNELLRHVDVRLEGKLLVTLLDWLALVSMTRLQHRSREWHLEEGVAAMVKKGRKPVDIWVPPCYYYFFM
jgi:hypothetical protein